MTASSRLDDGARPSNRLGRTGWVSIRVVLALAAVAAIGFVAVQLRVVVVPTILAMMLAAGLEPAIKRLDDWGVPPGWSAAMTMLATGLGMAAAAAWVFSLLWSAGQSLGSFTSNAGADITNWLQNGPLGVSATDVSKLVSDLGLMSASSGATLVHGILGGATTLAEIAEGLLLTVVFSVFFLVRRNDYAQWLTSSLPPASRGRADLVAAAIYRALGGYTRAVAVNGAINAVLVWLVLAVLGIPLAVPLAALAFVGGFFPVVGTISAGAVAALVALSSKGLGAAVAMVVATAILHHLEIYIVGPMVIGRTAKFHPAGQVAALAIGLALAGVVGLFLAGPLLTISITVSRMLRADAAEEVSEEAELSAPPDGRAHPTSSRSPAQQSSI